MVLISSEQEKASAMLRELEDNLDSIEDEWEQEFVGNLAERGCRTDKQYAKLTEIYNHYKG